MKPYFCDFGDLFLYEEPSPQLFLPHSVTWGLLEQEKYLISILHQTVKLTITSHLDEFLSESEGNLGLVPSKNNHLSCSGQNIHPHFLFPHFEQGLSFTGRDQVGFQGRCVTSNMMASDQPPAPGLTATEEV